MVAEFEQWWVQMRGRGDYSEALLEHLKVAGEMAAQGEEGSVSLFEKLSHVRSPSWFRQLGVPGYPYAFVSYIIEITSLALLVASVVLAVEISNCSESSAQKYSIPIVEARSKAATAKFFADIIDLLFAWEFVLRFTFSMIADAQHGVSDTQKDPMNWVEFIASAPAIAWTWQTLVDGSSFDLRAYASIASLRLLRMFSAYVYLPKVLVPELGTAIRLMLSEAQFSFGMVYMFTMLASVVFACGLFTVEDTNVNVCYLDGDVANATEHNLIRPWVSCRLSDCSQTTDGSTAPLQAS